MIDTIDKETLQELYEKLGKNTSFIHARCHPNQPLHARTPNGIIIVLSCAVCGEDVIEVILGSQEQE